MTTYYDQDETTYSANFAPRPGPASSRPIRITTTTTAMTLARTFGRRPTARPGDPSAVPRRRRSRARFRKAPSSPGWWAR